MHMTRKKVRDATFAILNLEELKKKKLSNFVSPNSELELSYHFFTAFLARFPLVRGACLTTAS